MGNICGLIHFEGEKVSLEVLRAMAAHSASGETAGTEYCAVGEVGLACQTQVAIHGEGQPIASPDGSVLLVADARLDNRPELQAILATEESLTSGELILAAYLRWGTGCPEHLLGDFAFAVWDGRCRALFCVSDPLGIKSLHYARKGPLLCFASQAQQILQHPAIPARPDELSLGLYLCGELLPDRTMFESVRRLPAAHHLVATDDGIETRCYWQVEPEKRTVYRRADDYSAHFRDLLSRAVTDRLPTPGETLGVAMSGGLDSTSVAALAREALARDGESPRLVAGSFVFDQLADCDERPYIRAMAAELKLEVETIEAERFWLLGDPEVYSPCLETPFMGWEGPFRQLFRRFEKRGVRVVFTGHGGDDVLGTNLVAERIPWRFGITTVRNARSWGSPLLPAIYRDLVSPLMPDWLDRALRRVTGRRSSEPEVPAWIAPDFARRIELHHWLRALAMPRRRITVSPRSSAGLSYLARHPAVAWLDRLAAPFGIEVRHPFLDRRLVEFVLSVPVEQVIDAVWHKPLLRRAMAGLLPEVVRKRPDKPLLASFFDFSLREKEAPRIERLLHDPQASLQGFIDRDQLQRSFRAFCLGTTEADRSIWQAITLELWLRRHGDRLGNRPTAGTT